MLYTEDKNTYASLWWKQNEVKCTSMHTVINCKPMRTKSFWTQIRLNLGL